jgi:hypothetical protein
MPSALAASRQYLARQLARLRASGFDKSYGEPDIKVEPFDSHNVSTPAALIKLGTSIEAARRKKANTARALETLQSEREKSAAQIALIRAQEKYYLGEGRQTGTSPRTLSSPVGKYPAGTDLGTVTAGQAQERIDEQRRQAELRRQRRSRIVGARLGIKTVEDTITNEVKAAAAKTMQGPVGVAITRVASGKGSARDLMDLGLPAQFYKAPPSVQGSLLDSARKRITATFEGIHRDIIARAHQKERAKFESVIARDTLDEQDANQDEAGSGFNTIENGGDTGDLQDEGGLIPGIPEIP